MHAPASVRCTALALGYNMTLGIVGGLSPLTASWLIERFEAATAPGYMIASLSAISLIALFMFRPGGRHYNQEQ